MEVRRLVELAFVLAGAAVAAACGTDAVDIDGCRQIEEARCNQALACGIHLTKPVFTSGTDVEACVRYYDDACLHGFAVPDPGPTAVNACVAAIKGDSQAKDKCLVVIEPQTDIAACGWLIPTPSAADASSVDAGVAVDAGDAATK